MNDEIDPKHSNRGSLIAGIVVAFMVIYILAPGPLSYFFKDTSAHEGIAAAIRIVFAPIGYLYTQVDSVRAFYDWYFGLFP